MSKSEVPNGWGSGSRTDGALVEVEEAAGKADEASQPHRLRKPALSSVRRGELLHGVEQAGAKGGRAGAVRIVNRPGVPNHALEMPAQPIESDSSKLSCDTGGVGRRRGWETYGSLSMS